ncbi:chromosomal protein MC1 [Haloplanus rubicundus]|uniref:Chromosomal protein MC1 n=2 Tax=Haloplanus rubicundus TaxID=1547898 RepID=A0A345E313_9EURY|nr:chromosomal protein MC1 [Haloplanus rubicundus]
MGVYKGSTPRHAALKAARELPGIINIDLSSEKEAQANSCEIHLQEKGTNKVHVYEAWAWEDEAPKTRPSRMGDTITEANVSKKGIEID